MPPLYIALVHLAHLHLVPDHPPRQSADTPSCPVNTCFTGVLATLNSAPVRRRTGCGEQLSKSNLGAAVITASSTQHADVRHDIVDVQHDTHR